MQCKNTVRVYVYDCVICPLLCVSDMSGVQLQRQIQELEQAIHDMNQNLGKA